MTDRNIELTRRKVLGAAGAIGAAGAGAGLGTSALFYDEESFLNNSITAGEVDMAVEAEVVAANDEYVAADSTPALEDLIGLDATADGEAVVGELTFPDFKNGDWIIVCWTITIVDNPVCLTVTPQNVENRENGANDAELAAGDDPESAEGELGEYLEGSFYEEWDDSGESPEFEGPDASLSGPLAEPVAVNDLGQVGPVGIPTEFTVYSLFELDPEEDDNDAQGDTVEFDLVFRGEQARNNECTVPDDGGEFEVELDDGTVIPFDAVESDETVESYYAYGDGPKGSSANTDEQRPDESVAFVYRNTSDGNLSLVFIHDDIDSGSGTSGSSDTVTFDITGSGFGGDGWVVTDGEGGDSFSFDATVPSASADWQWNDENTDGGALDIDSTFELDVDADFGAFIDFAEWVLIDGDGTESTLSTADDPSPVTFRST